MIPLAEQKAKLDRLLDERITHYRRGVAKNRLTLETASAKHAECEAIRASFAFLVKNQDWIRAEAQRRRAFADPAVAATLAAFPEAAVTAVRSRPAEATA